MDEQTRKRIAEILARMVAKQMRILISQYEARLDKQKKNQ